MSFEDECEVLETRFGSSWATATPIDWDNVNYKPVAGTSFVSFKVLNGFSNQASTGPTPVYRSNGVVDIMICTVLGRGRKTADDYADRAAAIFRGWRSSGLTCRAPYITRIGEHEGWYKINVTVPFFRDEHIALP